MGDGEWGMGNGEWVIKSLNHSSLIAHHHHPSLLAHHSSLITHRSSLITSGLSLNGSFRTMKPVWIIDDDRSIRWVFEKALTRENIAFKVFASAQEALQALSASTPQVVVSDIRMPGGSGLELLQKLKEKYPNLPVIIMTAYSDLESAVAAFQGGAFEYLPKPFDVDQAVD